MQNKKIKHYIFISISFLFLGLSVPPDTDGYESQHLFRIERSRDADEIIYDLVLDKDGKPNMQCPVNIYWIKHTTDGSIEPLTPIQNRFAYGIKLLNNRISNNECNTLQFQLVSNNEFTFTIKKSDNHKYKAYTQKDNKEYIVNKISINFENDSFWHPKISEIIIQGYEENSENLISEVITP